MEMEASCLDKIFTIKIIHITMLKNFIACMVMENLTSSEAILSLLKT
jgi:hypothetical protein